MLFYLGSYHQAYPIPSLALLNLYLICVVFFPLVLVSLPILSHAFLLKYVISPYYPTLLHTNTDSDEKKCQNFSGFKIL